MRADVTHRQRGAHQWTLAAFHDGICCRAALRSTLERGGRASPGLRGRDHDRLHLCRFARRLRLQPGARARRRRAEEDRRHQGDRRGEGAGDRRGGEDHGVDDQSRRRHAAVPDLVRLLQPARPEDGGEISQERASSIAADCGATRTRRTPAAISAISTRRNTSPASSPATPPRAASSASSPPSRSRRCCATSTPSRSAPGSPIPKATTQVIFTGDWSMPVKEAEATNSLIDQGVDVADLPRRRSEDDGRERGAPRRDGLRLSRQPVAAGAEGLSHRRRVELGGALSEIRQDDRRPAKPFRTSIAAA